MRNPVLTYHASTVNSHDYAGNDHVALATDLAMLASRGWRVVPLDWLVEQRLGLARRDLSRCLAVTCDDGTDLDARDVDYPGFGVQRGFLNCLRDARGPDGGLQPHMHMTAFVIADPVARSLMDRACLHGLDWMREDWWLPALQSGLMDIQCHSWDHNHSAMPTPGADGMARGDFHVVDNLHRAQSQIDRALAYTNAAISPHRCRFFAYPYGHANRYLVENYLPWHGERLGLRAAFGIQGEPLTLHCDRWQLPRYVCGLHWNSPAGLEAILRDCDG